MPKFTVEDLKHKNNTTALNDIRDGRLYKKLLDSVHGNDFRNQKAFSFLLNTDGISPMDRSKLTIWPVFLVINELPIESRFCIDNIILAGLSVAEQKPNFDIFFNEIVTQLSVLELGFDLSLDNVSKKRKFFLIAAVFDKPAKAPVLNMNQYNGNCGCTKCEQPGETAKGLSWCIDENEDLPEKISGGGWIYKFNKANPKGPLRTKENYEMNLKISIQTKSTVYGIKGRCCLSSLTYFEPVGSTCIDYMHSLLEGVVKTFFKYWFCGEITEPYSLKKFMQEIDKRINQISPPKFVASTPRSIYSHNDWRAHEYLSFMLYYALPVFRDVLNSKYYNNIKKLIVFMEIILSPSISLDTLSKAELIITDFVEEVSELYPATIMLSGLHELLHLADCTLDFGPLNCTNCFQFEEMNRKLLRFLHGHNLIGEELIKIFSTAQILSNYSNNVSNPRLKKYIQKNLVFKTSNKKKMNENKFKDWKPNTFTITNNNYNIVFEKYTKIKKNELTICHKIVYKGIVYKSIENKTKRKDSSFVNKTNQNGLIECFVIENNKIYVIAKKVVTLFNAYTSTVCPEIRSKSFVCYISEQLFVEEIDNLQKTVLININGQNSFVSLSVAVDLLALKPVLFLCLTPFFGILKRLFLHFFVILPIF